MKEIISNYTKMRCPPVCDGDGRNFISIALALLEGFEVYDEVMFTHIVVSATNSLFGALATIRYFGE
jgi:hypothetical protein